MGCSLLAGLVSAAISVPVALLAREGASGTALLDPVLRSAGCGLFYGLLAFHLQRVDPEDSHLQAGLVGAVCGIRSLGGSTHLPLPWPPGANLVALAPSLMMELVRAWLPLWLPLVGSALLLHGSRRLTPLLLPTPRP